MIKPHPDLSNFKKPLNMTNPFQKMDIAQPIALEDIKPRIMVMGVGGAGCNAVNNMIRANLEGVEFIVCNTDAQALSQSAADSRIQLGLGITQGLGAGSRPEVGHAAAEETMQEITERLHGVNMLFVTAGMGGGTGTGAAPVIARVAREMGILTVGVITKPFHFEGAHRMASAEVGIEALKNHVDTLIVIPNQNLFRIANENTTFADAFKMADEVLLSGVRSVTDLMIIPGLINLDFADIQTVMTEMGKAMMGTGEADGEGRAVQAAEAAIANPLLDEMSMRGAQGVLISVTGGKDMTLFEVDEAANRIRDEVESDSNIIFGSTFDERLDGRIRVSVVATGIDKVGPRTQTPELSAVASRDDFKAMRSPVTAAQEISPDMTDSITSVPSENSDISLKSVPGVDDVSDKTTADSDKDVEQTLRSISPQKKSDAHTNKTPSQSQMTSTMRPKAKAGFFARLAGGLRGKTSQVEQQEESATPAPSMAKVKKVEFGEEQDTVSEVPAFLRRQGKK